METLPAMQTARGPATPQMAAKTDDPLRVAAHAFEAAFVAEMLKHAGLGQAPDAFGGGAGETQFASFLVEAQARELVAAGGIGLADKLYARWSVAPGKEAPDAVR